MYILQGFLLGLAYVAPIGTQNMYVINSAIRLTRFKALQVSLITIFFDISLAVACYFGIGFLLEKNIFVKNLMLLIGSIVIVYIGIKLICSQPICSEKVKLQESLFKIIGTCFAIAWFNPQAVIDGSMLFGNIKATLLAKDASAFIMGVALASFVWFTSLALITSFMHKFISERILRIINILSGSIIIFYGLKLGGSFLF